ncbi:MAG: LCP family protein [Firmicutes bacterium]|nr:LCP family protein [Bacillota bacterium]
MGRHSKQQNEPKPKRKKSRRWIGVLVAIIVVLGGGAYGYQRYLSNLNNVFSSTVKAAGTNALFQHRITILLMGSSLETSSSNQVLTGKKVRNRSDTLILVSIDPKTKQVGVLSIPRDTRVNVPGVGMTKIAEATFFGGAPETVRVVENTFHVPIDYYAYISMFQFAKLINDMGGLTVDVPHNEVYDVSSGKLGINLHAGVQHLTGLQVLQFVRFRNTSEGDIGRIQQQQVILRDMAHQLLQPSMIPRIPALAHDLMSSLSATNMNVNQFIALGLFARHLNLSSVRYGTIPGHSSTHMDPYMHVRLSYWTYDPRLSSILVQDVLLADPLTAQQKKSLRVEILSGVQTLAPAQHLAQKLQAEGYTVTGVGWANQHNYTQSVITNTSGDRFLSQRFQQMLGSSVVNFVPYHTAPWDIEITVGSDYAG